MTNLSQLQCVACRGGKPLATEFEIATHHLETPEWKIIEIDNIKRLERVFKFKNFADALAFTNKVGAIAEAQDHHPAILTEWGRVTVQFWTHVLKGLHKNDFIMAARTDQLFNSGT
jgi:4a-hydroxytetrahydrobiopterin dehydratase